MYEHTQSSARQGISRRSLLAGLPALSLLRTGRSEAAEGPVHTPWVLLKPNLRVSSVAVQTGPDQFNPRDRTVDVPESAPVDWTALACEKFGIEPTLTQEQAIARFGPIEGEACGGCVRHDFEFPVARAPQPGFFSFVSMEGLTELEMVSLHGQVYFATQPEESDWRHFSGLVRARPRSGRMPLNGGFVIWSDEPLRWSMRLLRTTGRLPEFSYWKEGRDVFMKRRLATVESVLKAQTDIGSSMRGSLLHASLLEVNGYGFISVVWAGDEGSCSHWNNLYSASGPFREILASVWGCDV